ncbi:hypothetical protein OW565_10635 [Acidithiobacillus ferriphilus]|nr:hypothetical protein [Acidithiobacillus ferriphilus]
MKPQFVARFLGSDAALCTEIGQRKGHALVSTGQAGHLLYGPYMALEPGHYRVDLYGSAASVSDAFVDVCMETGQRILAEQELQATMDGQEGLLVALSFAVEAECQDMEVRVRVGRHHKIQLGLMEIYKVADFPRVGIVVVTYGMVPTRLVDSIHSKHMCEWYVHHHGSESLVDDITHLFAERRSHLHFHCENRGLAKSWNDGIIESTKSGNDITMVINDDVEFLQTGFDDWIEFILTHRDHGLIFLTGEEPQEDGTTVVRPQDFACFSFGPQARKLVGAFDEEFTPAYYEDMDYIVRASLCNISTHTDERILCRHERSSTKRQNVEIYEKVSYFWQKNRELMITKWGDATPGVGTYSYPFDDAKNSIFIPFREVI